MDPFVDDESCKKPCGSPIKICLPEPLRKQYYILQQFKVNEKYILNRTSRKRKVGKYPGDFYFVDTGIGPSRAFSDRQEAENQMYLLPNQSTSSLKSSSSSANPHCKSTLPRIRYILNIKLLLRNSSHFFLNCSLI